MLKATTQEVTAIFHRLTQGRFQGRQLPLALMATGIKQILPSLLACDFEVARERGLAIDLEPSQWTRTKPSC